MKTKKITTKTWYKSEDLNADIEEAFNLMENEHYCSDPYIYDLLHDIADDCTSFYYSTVYGACADIADACEECVAEGLYVVEGSNFDLFKFLQCGYYQVIYSELCEHLGELLYNRAVNIINACGMVMSEEQEKELEEELSEFSNNFDWNDTLSDFEYQVKVIAGLDTDAEEEDSYNDVVKVS